jgi:hypothetical protein
VIEVEQRYMAIFDERGDNVQRGDCLTACVASIFELPIDEVPFFVEHDNWWQMYQDFFRDRGLCLERAWIKFDRDDRTKLTGWPGDRFWIGHVYSPRGKSRCPVCKGEKVAQSQWFDFVSERVEFDEPQPCNQCKATGLTQSLHAVVMHGRDLVWDPHPQRDMGHLGFLRGEQFGVPDPAVVRRTA